MFIEEVKKYLKIDSDDEDIGPIVEAVIQKCENETGKMFVSTDSMYAQAVKMIAADWYNMRGTTTEEKFKELPLSLHVQNILNHIAISDDYEVIE